MANCKAGKKWPNNYSLGAAIVFELSAMSDVNLGIWDKLTKVVLFLLVVAIILLVVVWYIPLIQQNERMRKEILRKDGQVALEVETQKQMITSVDTFRSDPKAVERLAREKFGYAKPGETVIRFEENPTNTAPTR